MLVTIYRVIKFAWQGFWRNFWLSLVTISIIALASLTVNALLALNVVADSAVTSLEQKIDVSIYFDPDVATPKVKEVQDYLSKLSQVSAITLVTADDAMKEFRQRHARDAAILETLEELGDNPLGATLVVTAQRPSDYPEIIQVLNHSPYRDLVSDENYKDHQRTINEIRLIADRINQAGIAISALFILIATLIVFNTIRVAIYTHRDEIGIMKLVGASNAFITAPFVLEGVLYALCATGLAVAVTFPLLNAVQPYLQDFFTGVPLDLAGYFRENFIAIFGSQLLGMSALNMLGSVFAVRRYLKV
ncbi:MAG: permease-like cell division protein FtsX [bacterium]|nr:permease-like cell division protein FtsX [bacterium]